MTTTSRRRLAKLEAHHAPLTEAETTPETSAGVLAFVVLLVAYHLEGCWKAGGDVVETFVTVSEAYRGRDMVDALTPLFKADAASQKDALIALWLELPVERFEARIALAKMLLAPPDPDMMVRLTGASA